MKKVDRFQRGSGTYICRDCGKRTRETGDGESYVGLCADCYWYAGEENAVNDGNYGCPCGCEEVEILIPERLVRCAKCKTRLN